MKNYIYPNEQEDLDRQLHRERQYKERNKLLFIDGVAVK